MITKHKAKINVPLAPILTPSMGTKGKAEDAGEAPSSPASRKRKAEEDILRPATHTRIF
jgi:hypothetical protein